MSAKGENQASVGKAVDALSNRSSRGAAFRHAESRDAEGIGVVTGTLHRFERVAVPHGAAAGPVVVVRGNDGNQHERHEHQGGLYRVGHGDGVEPAQGLAQPDDRAEAPGRRVAVHERRAFAVEAREGRDQVFQRVVLGDNVQHLRCGGQEADGRRQQAVVEAVRDDVVRRQVVANYTQPSAAVKG